MKEHSFSSIKTNRYYVLGTPSAKVKHIWYVIHGYGHLAKFFIRHFRGMDSPERMIIAPEGSHHFYLSRTSGRVGASWMTKENRLADIEDYCNYLNQLHQKILQSFSHPVKVHILGFSQGVATAFRWTDTYLSDDLFSLHCWAGTLPPDVDYGFNHDKFKALRITASFGSSDEYISPDKANELEQLWKDQNLVVHRMDYEGGHSFNPQKLKEVFGVGEEV